MDILRNPFLYLAKHECWPDLQLQLTHSTRKPLCKAWGMTALVEGKHYCAIMAHFVLPQAAY